MPKPVAPVSRRGRPVPMMPTRYGATSASSRSLSVPVMLPHSREPRWRCLGGGASVAQDRRLRCPPRRGAAAPGMKTSGRQMSKRPPGQVGDAIIFTYGGQTLYLADCFDWLREAEPNSVHAVVTDPPYGLVEYHPEHQRKLRAGQGGVWRIPPSFDGANRRPLPRFTVLSAGERTAITGFFRRWAEALLPVLRPGGHVVIAGSPLTAPLVAQAMEAAGFERRGELVRLVRTFRGGDRPKGAHDEFPDVSTMPRGCWEPWGLYRRPIDCHTVAENLRRWGTGGLRRKSRDTPFLDVIPSGHTPERERA